MDAATGLRIYEEVKDNVKLNKTLLDKLSDYNSESKNKMELVFFEYMVELIIVLFHFVL